MEFLKKEAQLAETLRLARESQMWALDKKQVHTSKLWEAFDGWRNVWECCIEHAAGMNVTCIDGTPFKPIEQIAKRLRQIYDAIGTNGLFDSLTHATETFLKDAYASAQDRSDAAAIQGMLQMLLRIHRGDDESTIAKELFSMCPRPNMHWAYETIYVLRKRGDIECPCGKLIEPRWYYRGRCSECIKKGHGKTLQDLSFDLRCVSYGVARTEDQPIDQCPAWPNWRITLRREFGIEKSEVELFDLWQRWAEVHHSFDTSNKFQHLTIAAAEKYLPGGKNLAIMADDLISPKRTQLAPDISTSTESASKKGESFDGNPEQPDAPPIDRVGTKKSQIKVSVNARMIDTLQKNAESKSWSARKWGEHLGVAASTAHSQPAWKAMQVDKAGRKYFTEDEEPDLE